MASMAIDQGRFEALMGKTLGDIGGAMAVLMAYMGDRLGIYRAMAGGAPATSGEVAAKVGLDEKGTEAAAATAVVLVGESAGPAPATITLDRPFLFLIYDESTGQILFLGRVVDPS